MIDWSRMGCYNQTDDWSEASEDGVFGDIAELEASVLTGEQQIIYLHRWTQQSEKLYDYTGPLDGTPQEPHELPPIDEELPSDEDGWE